MSKNRLVWSSLGLVEEGRGQRAEGRKTAEQCKESPVSGRWPEEVGGQSAQGRKTTEWSAEI